MSRRKAFQAGEGAFVIADEFAEEVYIGIAEISAEAAPPKPKHSESFFGTPGSASRRTTVLLIFAFSLGAMIVGVVLARAWRWVGN